MSPPPPAASSSSATTTTIVVRPFRPEDSQAVVEILKSGFAEIIPNITRFFFWHRRTVFVAIGMGCVGTAAAAAAAAGIGRNPSLVGQSASNVNDLSWFGMRSIVAKLSLGILAGLVSVVGCYWNARRAAMEEIALYTRSCLQKDLGDIWNSYAEVPGCRFVVAVDTSTLTNQVVVGCCALGNSRPGNALFSPSLPKSQNRGELKRMSIRAEYRRSGVSKLLLGDILHFAKQQQYNELWLTTTQFQIPAHRLYGRYGFKLKRYLVNGTLPHQQQPGNDDGKPNRASILQRVSNWLALDRAFRIFEMTLTFPEENQKSDARMQQLQQQSSSDFFPSSPLPLSAPSSCGPCGARRATHTTVYSTLELGRSTGHTPRSWKAIQTAASAAAAALTNATAAKTTTTMTIKGPVPHGACFRLPSRAFAALNEHFHEFPTLVLDLQNAAVEHDARKVRQVLTGMAKAVSEQRQMVVRRAFFAVGGIDLVLQLLFVDDPWLRQSASVGQIWSFCLKILKDVCFTLNASVPMYLYGVRRKAVLHRLFAMLHFKTTFESAATVAEDILSATNALVDLRVDFPTFVPLLHRSVCETLPPFLPCPPLPLSLSSLTLRLDVKHRALFCRLIALFAYSPQSAMHFPKHPQTDAAEKLQSQKRMVKEALHLTEANQLLLLEDAEVLNKIMQLLKCQVNVIDSIQFGNFLALMISINDEANTNTNNTNPNAAASNATTTPTTSTAPTSGNGANNASPPPFPPHPPPLPLPTQPQSHPLPLPPLPPPPQFPFPPTPLASAAASASSSSSPSFGSAIATSPLPPSPVLPSTPPPPLPLPLPAHTAASTVAASSIATNLPTTAEATSGNASHTANTPAPAAGGLPMLTTLLRSFASIIGTTVANAASPPSPPTNENGGESGAAESGVASAAAAAEASHPLPTTMDDIMSAVASSPFSSPPPLLSVASTPPLASSSPMTPGEAPRSPSPALILEDVESNASSSSSAVDDDDEEEENSPLPPLIPLPASAPAPTSSSSAAAFFSPPSSSSSFHFGSHHGSIDAAWSPASSSSSTSSSSSSSSSSSTPPPLIPLALAQQSHNDEEATETNNEMEASSSASSRSHGHNDRSTPVRAQTAPIPIPLDQRDGDRDDVVADGSSSSSSSSTMPSASCLPSRPSVPSAASPLRAIVPPDVVPTYFPSAYSAYRSNGTQTGLTAATMTDGTNPSEASPTDSFNQANDQASRSVQTSVPAPGFRWRGAGTAGTTAAPSSGSHLLFPSNNGAMARRTTPSATSANQSFGPSAPPENTTNNNIFSNSREGTRQPILSPFRYGSSYLNSTTTSSASPSTMPAPTTIAGSGSGGGVAPQNPLRFSSPSSSASSAFSWLNGHLLPHRNRAQTASTGGSSSLWSSSSSTPTSIFGVSSNNPLARASLMEYLDFNNPNATANNSAPWNDDDSAGLLRPTPALPTGGGSGGGIASLARPSLSVHSLTVVTCQVEIFFLLSTLLSGKLRWRVHRRLTELRLMELLNEIFDNVFWEKRTNGSLSYTLNGRPVNQAIATALASALGAPLFGTTTPATTVAGATTSTTTAAVGNNPNSAGAAAGVTSTTNGAPALASIAASAILGGNGAGQANVNQNPNATASQPQGSNAAASSPPPPPPPPPQQPHPYNPTHPPDCDCRPETARKIQYLRLIHKYCDCIDFHQLRQHLADTNVKMGSNEDHGEGIVEEEEDEDGYVPLLGLDQDAIAARRTLARKLAAALVRHKTDSNSRYWLASALEAILRGNRCNRQTKDQINMAGQDLLPHLLHDVAFCMSNGHTTSRLQSSFDLLGEVIKFNPQLLRDLNDLLAADFSLRNSFLRVVASELVHSNVFLRSLVLSLNYFDASMRTVRVTMTTVDQSSSVGGPATCLSSMKSLAAQLAHVDVKQKGPMRLSEQEEVEEEHHENAQCDNIQHQTQLNKKNIKKKKRRGRSWLAEIGKETTWRIQWAKQTVREALTMEQYDNDGDDAVRGERTKLLALGDDPSWGLMVSPPISPAASPTSAPIAAIPPVLLRCIPAVAAATATTRVVISQLEESPSPTSPSRNNIVILGDGGFGASPYPPAPPPLIEYTSPPNPSSSSSPLAALQLQQQHQRERRAAYLLGSPQSRAALRHTCTSSISMTRAAPHALSPSLSSCTTNPFSVGIVVPGPIVGPSPQSSSHSYHRHPVPFGEEDDPTCSHPSRRATPQTTSSFSSSIVASPVFMEPYLGPRDRRSRGNGGEPFDDDSPSDDDAMIRDEETESLEEDDRVRSAWLSSSSSSSSTSSSSSSSEPQNSSHCGCAAAYAFGSCALTAFLAAERVPLARNLMLEVKLQEISKENICVINTTLVLFIFANERGLLPLLLQEVYNEEREQWRRAKIKWQMAAKRRSRLMGGGGMEQLGGNSSLPTTPNAKTRENSAYLIPHISPRDPFRNYHQLMRYWVIYYDGRSRDSHSLFHSSHIPWPKWRGIVSCLLETLPMYFLPQLPSFPMAPLLAAGQS